MVNNRLIKIIWQNQMSYLKSGEKFSINIFEGKLIWGEKNKIGDVSIIAKNMPTFISWLNN